MKNFLVFNYIHLVEQSPHTKYVNAYKLQCANGNSILLLAIPTTVGQHYNGSKTEIEKKNDECELILYSGISFQVTNKYLEIESVQLPSYSNILS